jgi:hypothetical protein
MIRFTYIASRISGILSFLGNQCIIRVLAKLTESKIMARPPQLEVAKENLGVRLDSSWIAEMKEIARATGRSLSDVATEAIGRYLKKDVSGISDELSQLKARVGELEASLGKLRGLLIE